MGMFQTTGSNERFGILEGSRQKTVAAAGSAQTDATLVGANINIVTGASGTNGVVLSRAKTKGRASLVYSSAATNALLLYPPVGGTINGGTLNASLSVAAQKPALVYAITALDFIVTLSA